MVKILKNVFIMRLKFTLFISLFALIFHKAGAVAPTWTVNPGSFQYNMTMVAVAEINCVELQSTTNRIGVFVAGQCRGTAYTSQVVNGKYTASLFVYSNLVQGENLTFMVYNAAMDSVFTLPSTLPFQQNASFGTSSVPHVLKNNNPPTNIALSALAFNENLAANTTIASLSATDPDAGASFVYSFVTGAEPNQNSQFSIVGSSLRVSESINFELQTNANIKIRATDNYGCYYDKNFTLAVNNVNESPTSITINDSLVNENSAAGTQIGVLTGVDPDAGESLTFSLATGLGDSNNTAFSIVGNVLKTALSFNYESKSSYGIRVRVKDAANLFYERALVIVVRDVNDAPTSLTINGSLTSASFAENRGIGTFVANLNTTDEDASSQFAYTFVSTGGNDNSSFQIVGSQLRSNIAFDYEYRQSYSVFIQSSDGLGGTIARQFLINVTDSNDAPTALALSSTSMIENIPVGTFVAKLSTTDPDASQNNFVYSFVAGAGSAGNAGFYISNDSLFTNMVYNYETASSYSIRVKTTDPLNGSFQQSFSISILDGNDAPSDLILSSTQINENSSLGTTIGTFTSVDQDASSTFVYSLVSGTGSTDNNSFSLLGGSLRTNSNLDYETKSSYSIRVRTSDGSGGSFEKAFTISILDVNDAPTNIALSANSLKENTATNTIIGALSTTDQDASSSFTYSFDAITGNDNSNFVITGSTLRSAASFNYENKSVYFVYILTNDGNGGTYSKQFQINILDSNDAPNNLVLSSPSISENKPINSYIGTFIPSDEDASGTYTYSLISGTGSTDNSSFFVRNDSLFCAVALDFEVKSAYSIRARVSNSSLTFDKQFNLNVVNDNDAPTDIVLSNTFVNENTAVSSVIGTFSSLDPDTGNVFSYALVPGIGATNNQQFLISGNQLRTNTNLNYEQQNSYSIRVQTSDGNGGTYSKAIIIHIVNVNDAPTLISLSNATIKENASTNSLVGLISTTDEDSASSHNYSLINSTNNDNNKFVVIANQLRTNSNFDFETKQTYTIQIQSNDGNGGTFDKQFVVQILDSNDAPNGLSLNSIVIDENMASNTFIANINTSDPDATGTHTYALVAGTGSSSNSSFVIRNDSLFSNSVFDYESSQTKSIRIRTTDNGALYYEQSFVINVLNKNDAPTALVITNQSISENLPSRSNIGYLSTTDQDANGNFSYSFVSGTGSTDNASFNINGNELRTNAKFNYEVKSSYSIRVKSSDGIGGDFEQVFAISILDSNDMPTGLDISNASITENKQLGSFVGNFNAIDEDASDNFTYSFYNGASNDNSKFILVNNQLRSGQLFNYEDRNFYIIYVKAEDNLGLSITKQFVVSILDSNDVPTALELGSQVISENLPANSFIGTLTTTDADQLSGFGYTLVGGSGATDNAMFNLSNDSLYSSASFNYEIKPTYSLRLRSTDAYGAFIEKAFDISVTNENDAPSGVLISNALLDENAPIGSEIGSFTSVDEDAGETFEYAFVSGNGDNHNGSFKLVGSKLVSNFIGDFETQKSYSVRIKSTDHLGLSKEQIIGIAIKDIAEKPIVKSAAFDVNESASIGTIIGTVIASSPDTGSSLVYELEDNQYFKIDATSGKLELAQKLDYEAQKQHLLLVKVSDSRDPQLTSSTFVTIMVIDEVESAQKLPVSNVMSPNGDGMNDAFVIENVELYSDYSLTIFNGSGQQVFQILSNYQNNWEGTFEGSTLPTGVYYFVFSNKTNEFKGSINIIR